MVHAGALGTISLVWKCSGIAYLSASVTFIVSGRGALNACERGKSRRGADARIVFYAGLKRKGDEIAAPLQLFRPNRQALVSHTPTLTLFLRSQLRNFVNGRNLYAAGIRRGWRCRFLKENLRAPIARCDQFLSVKQLNSVLRPALRFGLPSKTCGLMKTWRDSSWIGIAVHAQRDNSVRIARRI